MNQASESSTREKEKLPAWRSAEECLAYREAKHDGFYRDAFQIEAWIGAIIAKTAEQYAGNKSGHWAGGRPAVQTERCPRSAGRSNAPGPPASTDQTAASTDPGNGR